MGIESEEELLSSHKWFVGALFDEFARFDNEDLIGILDGRDSVCNTKTGLALHELVESFLNDFLVFVVERTSGFV